MKKLFVLGFAIAALGLFGANTASANDVQDLVPADEMTAELNHHHPYPPYPQLVACYARNARGQVFTAQGYDAWSTQESAMRLCGAYSLVCSSLGCQAVGGYPYPYPQPYPY